MENDQLPTPSKILWIVQWHIQSHVIHQNGDEMSYYTQKSGKWKWLVSRKYIRLYVFLMGGRFKLEYMFLINALDTPIHDLHMDNVLIINYGVT